METPPSRTTRMVEPGRGFFGRSSMDGGVTAALNAMIAAEMAATIKTGSTIQKRPMRFSCQIKRAIVFSAEETALPSCLGDDVGDVARIAALVEGGPNGSDQGLVNHVRPAVDLENAHGLADVVKRALRLSHRLYGTPLKSYTWPLKLDYRRVPSDDFYVRRLLARDDWGRASDFALQQAFYIRSHWLRMPPVLLARHLWTKWRKRAAR